MTGAARSVSRSKAIACSVLPATADQRQKVMATMTVPIQENKGLGRVLLKALAAVVCTPNGKIRLQNLIVKPTVRQRTMMYKTPLIAHHVPRPQIMSPTMVDPAENASLCAPSMGRASGFRFRAMASCTME